MEELRARSEVAVDLEDGTRLRPPVLRIDLARLRADVHAGLHVVGACLPVELLDEPGALQLLAEAQVPLLGDIDSILDAITAASADTIAVASSHEIGADKLRALGKPVTALVAFEGH